MTKVIQDSDDEGDLSDSSPQRLTGANLTAMAPPAVIEGLATSTNDVSATNVNSTSSSESRLLREMRNAHDDMFEPSPSTSGKRARAHDGTGTAFATNGSSPSRLKRTKTASAGTISSPSLDHNLSGTKSSELKRSRTAGSSTRSPPKMFDSPTLGKKKKLQRTYSRKPAAYTLEDGDSAEQLLEQTEEELPVKDVAYKKLPATIVSDPLGQSQEIELQQTVAPLDTLHHKPLPSPINSSAFLSPTSVSDQFTQPTLNTYAGPSLDQGHMAEGFEGVNPNLLFPEMSSTVAASSSSIEKRLAGTANVDSEQNQQAEHEPDHSPIQDKPSQQDTNLGTTSSSGKAQATPDEATTKTANTLPDKRQKKYDAIASSDAVLPPSDDLIGLPKEMYKPRPSRSRSARSTQADTSASSEAGAGRLKKPRRSRTADGMSANTTQMLVDMGFTPEDSEAALIEADWVMDKALDILTRAKSESQSPVVDKSVSAAEDDTNKVAQPSFAEVTGEQPQAKDVEVNPEVAHDKPDTDTADLVNGTRDAQSKSVPDQSHVADAVKDAETAPPEGRPQDLMEFASKPGATNTGESPSSNTKLKRTKSTKSRGRPKKSEAKAVEDEQPDVDELSASAAATSAAADVHTQEVDETKPPEIDVKTDSKPSKRPREDKETSRKLALARVPDVEAEIIEIDDDSDGPPKATKLRRMMTAPASVLKKEKKKRGRPGKKTKTEATEAKPDDSNTTSLAKEDVGAPGPSQLSEAEKREVLQPLDKNLAAADQKSLQESVEETIEPKEASKKTKKAKTNGKNIDTPGDTPSRETPQPSVDGEEDSVAQAAADPKEASKKTKKGKANNKSVEKARETPSRETPQASIDEEDDTAEKPSTPKTSNTGKSATKDLANANDKDTTKKDTAEKKKGGHSPIKNVIRTVNYRVGLSKRTKIEPLLKIKRR